jgi:hypothetical protein
MKRFKKIIFSFLIFACLTAAILLHGFGASVYSWREVMDDFAQRGNSKRKT